MEDVKVVILCGGKGNPGLPFHRVHAQGDDADQRHADSGKSDEALCRPGFNNFVLAAGHRQEMLHDYFFGRFAEWKINIVGTPAPMPIPETGSSVAGAHVGERFFAPMAMASVTWTCGNLDSPHQIRRTGPHC